MYIAGIASYTLIYTSMRGAYNITILKCQTRKACTNFTMPSCLASDFSIVCYYYKHILL